MAVPTTPGSDMSESVCVASTSSMVLDGTLASSSCAGRPVQRVSVHNATTPTASA
jgi:hypothetical protein